MEPEKLKVTELREELSARGLSTKGLKAELVARLQEFLVNNPVEGSSEDKHDDDAVDSTEPAPSPKKTRGSPKKKASQSATEEEISAEQQKVAIPSDLPTIKAEVIEPEQQEVTIPSELQAEVVETEQKKVAIISDVPTAETEAIEPVSKRSKTEEPSKVEEYVITVPEADNPPSSVIHITNLHRPFHEKQLKDFIGMDCVDLWLNSIKSECLVRFETVKIATDCRTRLYNKTFPADSGHILKIDFGTVEQFSELQESENVNDGTTEAEASLTSFFKKTIVEPAIYYLPKE